MIEERCGCLAAGCRAVQQRGPVVETVIQCLVRVISPAFWAAPHLSTRYYSVEMGDFDRRILLFSRCRNKPDLAELRTSPLLTRGLSHVSRGSRKAREERKVVNPRTISLPKNIPDLVHKGLILKIFVFDLGELFENLTLLFGERLWRDQGNGYKEVALASTAEVWHTVIF